MVKPPKANNKCSVEHQRPKMSNFTLANLWILDIQFGTLHSEASVYSAVSYTHLTLPTRDDV